MVFADCICHGPIKLIWLWWVRQWFNPSSDSLIYHGLVQDCSISIVNALELLQFCTKPSIYHGLVQGCSISSANALEILQSCTKPSIHQGLVQGCGISIANALEILQSCTKPSTYGVWTWSSLHLQMPWHLTMLSHQQGPPIYKCFFGYWILSIVIIVLNIHDLIKDKVSTIEIIAPVTATKVTYPISLWSMKTVNAKLQYLLTWLLFCTWHPKTRTILWLNFHWSWFIRVQVTNS